MGQNLGTVIGLVAAYMIVFVILAFGEFIPEDIIDPLIVIDFLSRNDLELRIAVVSTVLYPSALGSTSLASYLGFGAQGATVLMFLAWGTAGLIAGLIARGIPNGVMASIFSVISGAVLNWLLVFFIAPGVNFTAILGTASLTILQILLESTIYPIIGATIGGVLGGAITRKR
ncbi:MAG: hypothetical protein R6V83_04835 [Candidatus Thorarchaeota archaeon]